MKLTNKASIKWKSKIELWATGAPMAENDIIYFRKALGHSGLKCEDSKDYLYNYFMEKMPQGGYNITNEQCSKGYEYLRKNTYKLNGNLRKNNIFGDFERTVLARTGFTGHKMTGLYSTGNGYFLPLYTAISEGFGAFEYTGNVYEMIRVTRLMPFEPKLRLVV